MAILCPKMAIIISFIFNHFRRAAVILCSTYDPIIFRGVKDLIVQADFGTTERHYIGAQSRLAGRALAKVLWSPRHKVTPDQTRI